MTRTTIDNTKPTHRWFQFRLRTLLIFMTLCAFPFAWVSWKLEQARREEAVITWVKTLGGSVSRHWYVPEKRKSWWQERTDGWFGAPMQDVDLENTQVSDLSPLAQLRALQTLDISNTQASDLSPLAGLEYVRWLILDDTPVRKLSPLAGLKDLEILWLINTPVSDLSPVAGLENLRGLNIRSTRVTNLSPLAELKNLEWLDLRDTQVTDLPD